MTFHLKEYYDQISDTATLMSEKVNKYGVEKQRMVIPGCVIYLIKYI